MSELAWLPREALTSLTPTEARWIFSSGSLTVQLKALSAALAPPPAGSPPAFSVQVMAEGWQALSPDELAALRRPDAAGTQGWVREVELCGPQRTAWVCARTVSLQTALEHTPAGAGRPPLTLTTLGDRPLGSVLFDEHSPFVRGPITVTEMTQGSLLRLCDLEEEEAVPCWTRRSLFRDDQHEVSILVAELFTTALWAAVSKTEQ
uniref:Chorismate lyase n=1 Tax=Strigomonas galati TaxID=1003336 RepID=T1YSB0_9TRYP|nr:chorismate lyase [Strigomonas galati]